MISHVYSSMININPGDLVAITGYRNVKLVLAKRFLTDLDTRRKKDDGTSLLWILEDSLTGIELTLLDTSTYNQFANVYKHVENKKTNYWAWSTAKPSNIYVVIAKVP